MTEHNDIRRTYTDKRAEWRFAYYAPGEHMKPHRHDCAQFSLVLTGSQCEISNGREVCAHGMSMALKPANFRHEAVFGDAGALLLSINLFHCDEEDRELRFDGWRVRNAQPIRQDWRALASAMRSPAPDGDALNDLTDDLLAAMIDEDAPAKHSSPPAWLSRAIDAILETDLTAGQIAKDAGVHRVHLSRCVRRYYGASLAELRRRRRLGRATHAMLRHGAAPAVAAVMAGFADQAHFTRHMRHETGLTPGALARIFHA